MTEGYNIAARRPCRKACHSLLRLNASGTLLEGTARRATEATAGASRHLPDVPPATARRRLPGGPPTVDGALRR